MGTKKNDPRLLSPQCHRLQPVKTCHTNNWFTVRDRGGYYTVEYISPQVIILPVVAKHSIVMVKVKRPVIADSALELPAGGAKVNETPLRAAARELFEETGIQVEDCRRFQPILPVAGAPNRNPELLYVYKVDLSEEDVMHKKGHDQEIDKVEILKFTEICSRISSGDIYVTTPIAVISRYLLSMGKFHL
ncbi:NUDIX hydrolase [Desulfospira joergensenii]|uniref:NUDIX hydrolase n=1 Tax=Desulfospira joergensenii TaxID=53329 RepID=UPI0003B649EB|nr:NUDIX hydrolase [Desulfospira joergensenii]